MTLKLNNFRLACFEFVITLHEKIVIANPGSAIRGVLGQALESICPSLGAGCAWCSQQRECAYNYLFLTPSQIGRNPRNYSNHPHPFVLEPPITTQCTFEAGQMLKFRLILIGKGISYLPYFIDVFQRGGEKFGLGFNRGTYELTAIHSIFAMNRVCIYDAQSQPLQLTYRIMHFEDIINASQLDTTDQVLLRFLTPTRLKIGERFISHRNFQFHHLFCCLLRRISDISSVHCDEELPRHYGYLIDEATKIKTQSELNWTDDWQHYSKGQKMKMKFGGIVGQVNFEGNLGEFLPFLQLGEWLHVGKSTAFGNGKYVIC
jgi:hypothetical protein